MKPPFTALLLLCALLLSGCHTLHIHTGPPLEGGHGLEPGDRIAAASGQGFLNGTVITVQGRLVTAVLDDDPAQSVYMPLERISRVGGESLEVGAWALCPSHRAWALCRVEGIDGDTIAILWATGGQETLDRSKMAPVPNGERAWAAKIGDKALRAIELGGKLADLIPASAGLPVQSGQPVLALWQDGNWWEASVISNEGATVTIAWADGSGRSTLSGFAVAPILPRPDAMAPGTLALCRWKNQLRWWRAEIRERQGDAFLVTYRDGEPDAPPSRSASPVSRRAKAPRQTNPSEVTR